MKKENIIFSNLYGKHDESIKGALKRGDWKNISKILFEKHVSNLVSEPNSNLKNCKGSDSVPKDDFRYSNLSKTEK